MVAAEKDILKCILEYNQNTTSWVKFLIAKSLCLYITWQLLQTFAKSECSESKTDSDCLETNYQATRAIIL